MKITVQEVFKCDFCGKRQFRKGDMTIHERWCKKNPANQHKCFQFCKHLIKEEVEYSGSDFIGKQTIFRCAVLEQEMYSFIAERRKLPVIKSQAVRMPLECDKYEDMNPAYSNEHECFFND